MMHHHTLDPLAIAKALNEVGGGSYRWRAEPFGPAGFRFGGHSHGQEVSSAIVTQSPFDDWAEEGEEPPIIWVTHASLAHVDRDPTYRELVVLHHAVWGTTGFAYQVFAPASEHVNIHEHALHLWGHVGGAALLPNFAPFGSI